MALLEVNLLQAGRLGLRVRACRMNLVERGHLAYCLDILPDDHWPEVRDIELSVQPSRHLPQVGKSSAHRDNLQR